MIFGIFRVAALTRVLALSGATLAGASCDQAPATSHVVLIDLPRGDPAPNALRVAWTKDCVGYGGHVRPDYLVAIAPNSDGKISISASRNDTSEVGRSLPIETSSTAVATPREAIARAPKAIGTVIEGEVDTACAYLYPDQSLAFSDVMLLHRTITNVGFRHVTFLNQEARE